MHSIAHAIFIYKVYTSMQQVYLCYDTYAAYRSQYKRTIVLTRRGGLWS